MNLGLVNKTALVTGASRGLGYAVARTLAQEGCLVAINSRDPGRLQNAAEILAQESGRKITVIPGDMADPAAPERVVKEAAGSMGGLDILVCNAGGPPPGKFEAFDDGAWQNAFDLSFMCHARLIRAALPYLRKSPAASVLTITSYSVKQPIPNLILSNSIRAATVGLTKSLALELGGEGIRFNSILPAWTETERVVELMSARAKVNGTTMEAEIARQAQESPTGRFATPDEFARAAVFLVSPAASYITGVMLTVDGGMYKGVL